MSLGKAKTHASTFRHKASANCSLRSTHNCVAHFHFHSGQWIVDASVVAIVEITAAFVVVDNTGREGKGRYTCEAATARINVGWARSMDRRDGGRRLRTRSSAHSRSLLSAPERRSRQPRPRPPAHTLALAYTSFSTPPRRDRHLVGRPPAIFGGLGIFLLGGQLDVMHIKIDMDRCHTFTD